MTGQAGAIRRGAAVLVLLAGAWLVLRDAMDRQFESTRPDLALRAWPPSGAAQGLAALQRAAAQDGVVDPAGRALIAGAMAQVPAAGLPLALAGLDASAAGDLPRATQLMERARHSAPRLVLVRTWLLNEYARTGRFDAALAEAGPVMRLSVESRAQVYALIAAIAARPDGAAAVRAALARKPDWAVPYQQWLAVRPGTAALQ